MNNILDDFSMNFTLNDDEPYNILDDDCMIFNLQLPTLDDIIQLYPGFNNDINTIIYSRIIHDFNMKEIISKFNYIDNV